MTHTPTEWAQMVSLAVALYASASVPYFLTVDADLADFDPRPALSRAVESGRVDLLLIAVADAKYDVHAAAVRARHIPRDAAISLAALLALLFPVAGGTR